MTLYIPVNVFAQEAPATDDYCHGQREKALNWRPLKWTVSIMGRLMGTGSLGMGSLSCGRTIELSAYHRSMQSQEQSTNERGVH